MPWLYNARIIAMYAVVSIHVSAEVVLFNDTGSYDWFVGNLYDSVSKWGLSVFVMISGALLLESQKHESISDFYFKRASRVLIPLLFWSFLYLAWRSFKDASKGDEPFTIVLMQNLMNGLPHYHMWFLYMIIMLYLFTPFFVIFIENSTRKQLGYIIIIMFFIAAINSVYNFYHYGESKSDLFINWFIPYIPYFFIGYFLRMSKKEYSVYLLFIVLLLSISATCLGFYFFENSAIEFSGFYFYDNLSFNIILMSISVFCLIKIMFNFYILHENITKKISLVTLGVYLMHPLILEFVNYFNIGTSRYDPLWSIPFTTLLVFFVCMINSWIIYQMPYLRRII